MIAVRFVLYMVLMLLFGLPLFLLHALSPAERRLPQIPSFDLTLPVLAIGGLVVSAFGFLLLTAEMAGVGMASLNRDTIDAVMASPVGTAWLVRMVALLAALALTIGFRRSRRAIGPALVSAAAALALAILAWAGHGASGEGRAGDVQVIADVVHLLAAGTWIGALAAFVVLLFQRSMAIPDVRLNVAANALRRFSVTGTLAVAAIVLTGTVNSYMLVGVTQAWRMPDTPYGQVLLAKLALFVLMLGLAAANRFRLSPALSTAITGRDLQTSLRALRISVSIEAGTALCVLGFVAWLGTLEPPIAASVIQ